MNTDLHFVIIPKQPIEHISDLNLGYEIYDLIE